MIPKAYCFEFMVYKPHRNIDMVKGEVLFCRTVIGSPLNAELDAAVGIDFSKPDINKLTIVLTNCLKRNGFDNPIVGLTNYFPVPEELDNDENRVTYGRAIQVYQKDLFMANAGRIRDSETAVFEIVLDDYNHHLGGGTL